MELENSLEHRSPLVINIFTWFSIFVAFCCIDFIVSHVPLRWNSLYRSDHWTHIMYHRNLILREKWYCLAIAYISWVISHLWSVASSHIVFNRIRDFPRCNMLFWNSTFEKLAPNSIFWISLVSHFLHWFLFSNSCCSNNDSLAQFWAVLTQLLSVSYFTLLWYYRCSLWNLHNSWF